MKKNFIIRYVLLTFLCLIIFSTVSVFLVNHYNNEMAKNDLMRNTILIKNSIEKQDSLDLEGIRNDLPELRITIVKMDGVVVEDTEKNPQEMENHLYREEIQIAIDGKSQVVVRDSDTLNQKMMYFAKKITANDCEYVLRVAIEIKHVNGFILTTTLTIAIIMVVMVGVLVLVASYTTKKSLLPLNLKLEYVLENMRQGIAVVSKDKEVLISNLSDKSDFLTLEDLKGQKISDAIDIAIEENTTTNFIEEKGARQLEINVSPMLAEWSEQPEYAAVVSARDISEIKLAEKSRSEFFANASHELKTPLTSIKGFSELSQIVDDETKRKQYAEKISVESDRMLRLIEDMLRLSKLEERAKQDELVSVDLCGLAEKCIQNLTPQATAKNIVIEKDLRKMIQKGSVENYTELLTNLIDNAIKYNKEGGKVFVSTNGNIIEVSDTGIGIPQKHQARVFERFYRVDKGRSRQSGGTGLGLSIVKHIAQKYNAEIMLQSSEKGTSIKIIF